MSRDFILVLSGGIVSLVTTFIVLFIMDWVYRRDTIKQPAPQPATPKPIPTKPIAPVKTEVIAPAKTQVTAQPAPVKIEKPAAPIPQPAPAITPFPEIDPTDDLGPPPPESITNGPAQ